MTARTVVVHRSADGLADAVAARLLTHLVEVQSAGRVASIVLTGGTIADKIHRAVAESPSVTAVDWRAVQVWWGDERFVPAGDEDRNDRQARAAMLDALPLDPAHVHPMPTPEQASDPDAAADLYAAELAAAAGPGDSGSVPTFDVLMLGIGPDGHVASLFPGSPALYDERSVVGVRGAAKPPPLRVSLTLPTLMRAQEVWFVAAGQEKAKAVRMALGDAGVMQVPAAGPRGLRSTTWLLDKAAAAELPPGLQRIASP